MARKKKKKKINPNKPRKNEAGLRDDPDVIGDPTAEENEYAKKNIEDIKEYWGEGEKKPKDSPVKPYKNIVVDSNDPGYTNRLLIATPTRGTVRMEWVMARYGQLVPTNFSMVQQTQFMMAHSPIRFSVANAQNVIVKSVIEKGFEWLLLLEDDVILPEDAFLKFNKYIRNETAPVVSGLYFTKTNPSEPLIYRGRGTSYYGDWEVGDLVWADGVPTGALLIHAGLLRAIWDEAPEYSVNGVITRRVFDTPRKIWYDPKMASFNITTGTSDLEFCTKVMDGGFFKKSGWDKFQKKKYPFLVDTSIACKHIDINTGKQYPLNA